MGKNVTSVAPNQLMHRYFVSVQGHTGALKDCKGAPSVTHICLASVVMENYALPTRFIQHNLLCRMSCLSYCKYCCLASVVKAYLARSSILLLFCNGPQRLTSTSKAYMQLCGVGGVWEARNPPHQLEKEHCAKTTIDRKRTRI
jgi:hypothetical protein